jgi:TonB family protein
MPINVRSCYSSVLSVLFIFTFISFTSAQTTQTAANAADTGTAAQGGVRPPTLGEVMQGRLSKAKAFIAVRNYPAAIFELESIRRETSDPSVNAVANVLLMNSLLEQGNYKKARDILGEFYKGYQSNNAHADVYYPAIAGQIVKGARNQIERYRGLGLSVSDRNLPLEAVNDIEQMRETLELVMTQAREIAEDERKAGVAWPLLEEATAARSSLARDDYDARRWTDEIADVRERMTSSRSFVFNAVVDPAIEKAVAEAGATEKRAANMADRPAATPSRTDETVKPAVLPIAEKKAEAIVGETPDAAEMAGGSQTRPKPGRKVLVVGGGERPAESENKAVTEKAENDEPPPVRPDADEDAGTLKIGQLIGYATRQQQPTYPQMARSIRASGIVRVEIVVDENGDVAEIQNATGHALLQNAAKDAVAKWKFRPFVRDGHPVKATGFINFNFSL